MKNHSHFTRDSSGASACSPPDRNVPRNGAGFTKGECRLGGQVPRAQPALREPESIALWQGGMTVREVAAHLGCGKSSVQRDITRHRRVNTFSRVVPASPLVLGTSSETQAEKTIPSSSTGNPPRTHQPESRTSTFRLAGTARESVKHKPMLVAGAEEFSRSEDLREWTQRMRKRMERSRGREDAEREAYNRAGSASSTEHDPELSWGPAWQRDA